MKPKKREIYKGKAFLRKSGCVSRGNRSSRTGGLKRRGERVKGKGEGKGMINQLLGQIIPPYGKKDRKRQHGKKGNTGGNLLCGI